MENFTLQSIAHNWEVIFEEIDTYDVAFASEDEAVDWLVGEILDAEVADLSPDEQEEAELRELVAAAYADAVDDFLDQVATDDELANRLQTDLQTDIIDQIESVLTTFERLSQHKCYNLYEFPEERDAILDALQVNRETKFVDRPMLVPESPSAGRHLILGPSGSGKSRVIAERLNRLAPDAVEYVLIPDDQLLDTADARALARESFDGDLLLVWEDLHRVDGGREDGVVRNVLTRLDSTLADQNHRLQTLLEAQSGRLDDVFGNLPADFQNEKSLWHSFEPLWMNELDEEGRHHLANRMADRFGIKMNEDARERLIKRTSNSKSAPVYIETVFKTAGEELTRQDIAALADEVATIWKRQYEHLRQESSVEWQLLTAMKYLHDLHISLFSKLLYTVFIEHLDGDRERFRSAVNSMSKERQWITVDGDNVVARETKYEVHETQLEAVPVEAQDDANELSDLLRRTVSETVPAGSVETALVNSGVAYYQSERYELAAKHYEKAFDMGESSPTAHNNYAALLDRGFDDPEAAIDHFEQALEIDPEYGQAHYNYGLFLIKKLNNPEAAANHFKQAIALDTENSERHYNYAVLLENEFGDYETAAEHYQRALELDPKHIGARNNYALLLHEELNKPEAAAHHYQQVLEIDQEDLKTHFNYANLLKDELDDPEAAADHYQRGLALNPENPEVAYNYAILLDKELDDPEAAAKQYEQAIKIDPEFVPAHNNYAVLLEEDLDNPEDAVEHYQRAIEILLERGDQQSLRQAIDKTPVIARFYEDTGRSKMAVEICNGVLKACEQQDLPESEAKEIRAVRAEMSARNDADRVPELYWYGLDALRGNQPDYAATLLEKAWDLHTVVDDEPAVDAVAAGVWCIYLSAVDLTGDPIEEASEVSLADRPIVSALITAQTSDESVPTPMQYRAQNVPGYYGHELDAWESLLNTN